jgi:hypothetical protein
MNESQLAQLEATNLGLVALSGYPENSEAISPSLHNKIRPTTPETLILYLKFVYIP